MKPEIIRINSSDKRINCSLMEALLPWTLQSSQNPEGLRNSILTTTSRDIFLSQNSNVEKDGFTALLKCIDLKNYGNISGC